MNANLIKPPAQNLSVNIDSQHLQAELVLPKNAHGMILFVHGSGVGRYSTRNRYLAHVLRQTGGFATVSIDLLTPQEEAIDLRSKHCSSNVQFLATRLIGVTDWLANHPATSDLKIGYFGDRTGAGAALLAAAQRPMMVGSVVSRSGNICLTESVLSRIQAPTLLMVAENDLPLITMNEDAIAHIKAPKQLKIISGADHKFQEPGALDEVARLASRWFQDYLEPSR